jgi:hypothetical protein
MIKHTATGMIIMSAIVASGCGSDPRLHFEDAARIYEGNVIAAEASIEAINARFHPTNPLSDVDWLIVWIWDEKASSYKVVKNNDGLGPRIAGSSGFFMVLKSKATPTGMLKLAEASPVEMLRYSYGDEWIKSAAK